MSYDGIMDQIEDVYDWYECGDFSDDPDGAFAYLVDFRDMLPELIPNYGKRSCRESSLVYTCQTRRTFFVLVCFLYKFLKGGYFTDMNLMNCYYRSKDKFACKELENKMTFIEKFYEENFDKIPTKYEKPLYIPKNQ